MGNSYVLCTQAQNIISKQNILKKLSELVHHLLYASAVPRVISPASLTTYCCVTLGKPITSQVRDSDQVIRNKLNSWRAPRFLTRWGDGDCPLHVAATFAGIQEGQVSLEIKTSAQTSFPVGFTTGLSLIHLNVPEEKNPVGRGPGRTVSPPCASPPRLRETAGRQPSAVLWVTSQQMLPGITTRKERRRHVQGQLTLPREERRQAGRTGISG